MSLTVATPGGPAVRRRRAPRLALRTMASRVALLALTLLAWELASRAIDSQAFPTVRPTLQAGWEAVRTSEFWSSIGDTLTGWAIGLAISAVIAIPLGLIIGASPVVMRLTRGAVEFLRTVPSIMLVPLVVLMYGSTIRMKIVLIVLAAVWPLLLHAAYGIREVDRVARDTAKSFHVPWRLRLVSLYLPSSAPLIATGLRIAATIALLISVGAEIITSAPGIGYDISIAQSNGNSPRAYVFIVVAGLLGVAINAVFAFVESRVLAWHVSQRTGGWR